MLRMHSGGWGGYETIYRKGSECYATAKRKWLKWYQVRTDKNLVYLDCIKNCKNYNRSTRPDLEKMVNAWTKSRHNKV